MAFLYTDMVTMTIWSPTGLRSAESFGDEPTHDVTEDCQHRRIVKLINRDGVEVMEEASSDSIAPPTGRGGGDPWLLLSAHLPNSFSYCL